jgi:hypothetical protein
MPAGGSPTVSIYGVARALVGRGGIPASVIASEAALLGGKKAKTPIIAGSICGGVMLIAWIIGFGIYFRKRYNRKQRNRLIAEGKAAPRKKDLEIAREKVVIPPDPAILLGQRKPGEMAFPEREEKEGHHHLPWSHHHHGLHAKPGDNSSPPPTNSSSPQYPESSPGKSESSPRTTEESTIERKEDDIVDEMTVPANL